MWSPRGVPRLIEIRGYTKKGNVGRGSERVGSDVGMGR